MPGECLKISDHSKVIKRRSQVLKSKLASAVHTLKSPSTSSTQHIEQKDVDYHHNKPLSNTKMAVMQWGCSDFQISKVCYEWKIRHFSHRSQEVGRKLLSPAFYSGENKEHQWVMELYLGGVKNDVRDHISLFLTLENSAEAAVNVAFQMSILNPKDGTRICFHETQNEMTEGACWGTSKFVLRSTLLENKDSILVDDTLTIRCELQVFSDCKYTSELDGFVAAGLTSNKHRLAPALNATLDDQMYTDMTLMVADKPFAVHKFILAGRSSVFAKLFSDDSSVVSTTNSSCVINDVEPDVMASMLKCMYTDEVPNEDQALPLLSASKKYEFKYLEEISRALVLQTLHENNVIDILIHAHDTHDYDLKRYAIDYILGHEMEIGKTEKFKDFSNMHPMLLIEIYQARISKLAKEPEEDKTLYSFSP